MTRALPLRGLAAGLAVLLSACGDGGGSGGGFFVPPPAPAPSPSNPPPQASGTIGIRTLSNRADMISDGNAYVEIVLPKDSPLSELRVALNGADITERFALRPNGRVLGLVEGLRVGANSLVATGAQQARGRLQITNHTRGGPIFAGPQAEPWVCATRNGTPATITVPGSGLSATVTTRVSGLDADPVDDQCNAPTKYSYYYMPRAKQGSACTPGIIGADPCHLAYDPAKRPADDQIADFTNDRGDTVKHLLRLELGTMGRGMYQILGYYDPAKPWEPWAPQKGWNGKLLWKYGASASGNRYQEQPAGVTDFGGFLFDPNALAAGHLIVNATLTNHHYNNNELLAAESTMRIKEHLIEHYGEVRYTMADGGSGGSMMQTVVASVMPGLLQGIQTGVSYPDSVSTWIETRDCGLLTNYYAGPNGAGLADAARSAINGHPASYCTTWANSFILPQNPTLPINCGLGFPAALVYDPVSRPDGVRCSIHDMMTAVFGTAADTDGHLKPKLPYDNVGVQYGLKALQSGAIDAEAFVRLNEGIGSYTADMAWTGGNPLAPTVPAARSRAPADVLARIYASGLHSNAKHLAQVAFIDLRPEMGSDIHMGWRSFQQRARLDAGNGHHDNHVIRASKQVTGTALTRQAFRMMDRWLGAIERDGSDTPLPQKVVQHKPADAKDGCFTTSGAADAELVSELALGDAACPLRPTDSPRQIAGGPRAEDVYKCQLKPLSFASPDYAGLSFSPAQQARLAAVFPEGVCDWSRPGVGQTAEAFLADYAAGPDGRRVGAAPVSGRD